MKKSFELFVIYKKNKIALKDKSKFDKQILPNTKESVSHEPKTENSKNSKDSEPLLPTDSEKINQIARPVYSRRQLIIKMILCSLLNTLCFYPLRVGTYELEYLGLDNISLTSTIITIGDLVTNSFLVVTMDHLPRKRGLIHVNLLLFVFSCALLIGGLTWKGSGLKIFNMVFVVLAKSMVLASFNLSGLFIGKFGTILINSGVIQVSAEKYRFWICEPDESTFGFICIVSIARRGCFGSASLFVLYHNFGDQCSNFMFLTERNKREKN